MKNFRRGLSFVWPYRKRYALSVVFAVLTAAFWGGSLTMVLPVLTVLFDNQSLPEWINGAVRKKEADTAAQEAQVAAIRQRLADGAAVGKGELALAERRLTSLQWKLRWHRRIQPVVERWCPAAPFPSLLILLGFLLASNLLRGFFLFWQEVLVGSAVQLGVFDLRNQFYRRSLVQDMARFDERGTGVLLSYFTNDLESLATAMETLLGKVVREPMKAASCLLFACLISWQLVLLSLFVVPMAGAMIYVVGRYMKRANRKSLETMSSIYRILQETFGALAIIKIFTQERYERRRFFVKTKSYFHKSMRIVKLDALSGPLLEVMGIAAISSCLLAGAYLVLNGRTDLFGVRLLSEPLEPAELLAFYTLLAGIADPVRKLSNVYGRLQRGSAAADRVFAEMDREPTIVDRATAPALKRHHRNIEFAGVSFAYHETPVLRGIQLNVSFGETLAIVGPNGSGKTTLVKLLARFYDPTAGAVKIDGVDIREVRLRSIRQQIGMVTQETVLFEDTIYNNVRYGNRHATRAQVEAAAKSAYAHQFIEKLPERYETLVGERGANLSGGERQRLALARAILRDPAILILDEATSALDMESESLIQRALRDFARERTTFLITHRLSTLALAQRIVVFDGGRIQAVGSHAELLKSCVLYRKLHDIHFKRDSA